MRFPVLLSAFIVLVALVTRSAGSTFTFGDAGKGSGWVDTGLVSNQSATQTCTFSTVGPNGAINFVLTIEGSGVIRSNNDTIQIGGGSNASYIDSGVWSDPSDDEWIKFTLKVTGPGAGDVLNLALGGIQLLYANDNDNVEFSDGTKANDYLNPANKNLAYNQGPGSALDGLTPLTVADAGSTWQLRVKAVASGTSANPITTSFRFDNLTISYRLADPVERVSDRLGVAHTGGKYWLTGENYLNEGAERIQELGGRVVKVFLGKDYANQFPWNSSWPVVNSLVELAETPYFREFFSRPDLSTYIIDATEFGPSVNWKDGMSSAELQNSYNEVYRLAVHLLTTYSHKTFVIQNWEGDNAFGHPADVATAEKGMADWLNNRQLAITDARNAVPASTSKIYGAAEFNYLPAPFMAQTPAHMIITTVIPNTIMDLYSLSNYLTGQNDGRDDFIYDMLNYMDSYCPDSAIFGHQNLYFGEFGAKENNLGSEVLQRQVAGRQIEQAFKWGVRYIVYWAIYDNVLKKGVVLAPGQEATNEQLLGNWLIRPDGTLPQIHSYFGDILGRSYSTYRDRYEFEQSNADSPTNDTWGVQPTPGASGGYLVAFDANAATGEIHYALEVPVAGTYDLEIGYQTGADAGIMRVFVSGVARGDQIDTYAATPALTSTMVSVPVTFTTSGLKDFKFRAKGKNPSSAGYHLYLDYVRLIADSHDTTPPTLTVPDNITAEATSAAGAVVTYPAATASDAVGVTSLTYSQASGTTFPIGATVVTVTAGDAAGNTSTGHFTVTVQDTTPPAIVSAVPSPDTLGMPNHKMVPVTIAVDASDAVGVASLKIIGVTSSELDNGLGDGNTAGDVQITGDLSVNLRAERSGTGNGRTYTITVEARDAAGNASTKTCTVSVPKSQGNR